MGKLTKEDNIINFDNIALYINTTEGLTNVRYLFDNLIKEYDINLEDVTILYTLPNTIDTQVYGLDILKGYVDWIETLGMDRINFYTELPNQNLDLICQFNYAVNTPTLVLFFGELNDWMTTELESYREAGKLVIHITKDIDIKSIWVGSPDNVTYYVND